MDWLIAGGILGLVAYLSIFFSAIYYVFVQPLLRKDGDELFTVTERGVLLGLLAGYFVHNLVVFDNIVSYIFYGTILAFIHARVSRDIPAIRDWKINRRVVEQVVAPVVLVATLATVYFVNIPGIAAAKDIINAFQAQTPEIMLEAFDDALSGGSFADQEVREQLTRQTQNIIRSNQVLPEMKQAAFFELKRNY